jgi:hypothetical protein
MSENTQVQSDTESKAQLSEDQKDNTSTYTTEQLQRKLAEVNAEAKENRKRAVEEKRKREEFEKATLAEKGQFKELADAWQRKATEAETAALKIKQAFVIKTAADAVMLEAQKLGCVDPEVVVSLVNVNDIPIDDNFNVDKNNVKVLLEDVRKSKSYLFKQPAPKVIDATPSKPEEPKLELSKMTIAERAALLSKLNNQGK